MPSLCTIVVDLSVGCRCGRVVDGVLYQQVRDLDETANRLMNTHPDQAQSIYEHQKEINERWNLLTGKVSRNVTGTSRHDDDVTIID